MRNTLTTILIILSRALLWRSRPFIIAVTGSVGKTTTKEAIGHVLREHYGRDRVMVSGGNYNTPIGVALTLVGQRSPERSVLGWLVVVTVMIWRILCGLPHRYYVMELAADRPGDIRQLAQLLHPQIGVVTAVGEIPVHVEFYESPLEVAAEKAQLVEAVAVGGMVVLNRDEQQVWAMRRQTRADVVGVGFHPKADVRGEHVELILEHIVDGTAPTATLKVSSSQNSVPLRLRYAITRGQVRAALTAIAVVAAMEVPLLDTIQALADWKPPEHRMRPLRGRDGIVILDDTYNAAPLSMTLALETVGALKEKGHRVIAVLGDMRELGKFSEQAHIQAGKTAARHVSILLVVGQHASFVRAGALEGGMLESAVQTFHVAQDAAEALGTMLQKDDTVLVKGSRVVGMDTVVDILLPESQRH